MSERRALVTLAVGADFQRRWRDVCRDNWQQYATRHGYEIICIEAALDDSPRARDRSAAWQKCLTLSQPFSRIYDRLVWIDLDILINPLAPDVCQDVPIEMVGAVDEFSVPTPELHRHLLVKNYARWMQQGVPFISNQTPEDYYTAYGFERGFPHVVQTGVLVLSPLHHRDILETVYARYDDKGRGWNYEMRPLSYELMRAGCVHWLDPRFNYIWGHYASLHFPFLADAPDHPRLLECVRDARRQTFFLHFAGSTELMPTAAENAPAPARHAHRPFRAIDFTLETTPVALFIFNRPHTTAAVFDAVRRVRPRTLLVVADAPRPDQADDIARCAAARAIVKDVDWPCAVRFQFADQHLGLKRRFDSGMQWIFSQCDEAIVLEDDCVPDVSFFRFCAELLARYRDDERVWSISGNNFQFGHTRGPASYYCSRYGHTWGWATWRRAWALYDPEMKDWPTAHADGWLASRFASPHAQQYWSYIFDSNYRSQEHWDYAWNFSYWRHGGIHIVPNVNLVSNHGFGIDATHTRQVNSTFSFLLTEPMQFPLIHPVAVAIDDEADAFTEEIMYSGTLKQAFARVRNRRRPHDTHRT